MIKSIGHVAFDAYKWEETFDFYNRVLGFEEMFRLHDEEDKLWLVYLRVSDEIFLELYPKNEEIPSEKDRHFSHLCLHVDDIEMTTKLLLERGGILDSEIKTGKDGNQQAWTRDPEGNRIEFMQIAPDGLQMRAIERIKETKIAA